MEESFLNKGSLLSLTSQAVQRTALTVYDAAFWANRENTCAETRVVRWFPARLLPCQVIELRGHEVAADDLVGLLKQASALSSSSSTDIAKSNMFKFIKRELTAMRNEVFTNAHSKMQDCGMYSGDIQTPQQILDALESVHAQAKFVMQLGCIFAHASQHFLLRGHVRN